MMDKSLALFIVQALISAMSLIFCFCMLAWASLEQGERSLLYSTISLILGMWMRKPSFSSTKKNGSGSAASTPSSSAPEYSDPPTPPPHLVVESNK